MRVHKPRLFYENFQGENGLLSKRIQEKNGKEEGRINKRRSEGLTGKEHRKAQNWYENLHVFRVLCLRVLCIKQGNCRRE